MTTKLIEEEKGEQKRIGQVNNIILKIMKDIMETNISVVAIGLRCSIMSSVKIAFPTDYHESRNLELC
jgi:hypothetical protein